MIFVTVGTHEQQFNRLLKCMEKIKNNFLHSEEIIIQMGYSDFTPSNCKNFKMLSYIEMEKYVKEARIVITHGGPASFMLPLREGKIPIVVPRRKEFDEHVNNHQVDFCNRVKEVNNNIIVVNDIEELKDSILGYEEIIKKMKIKEKRKDNNFCYLLEELVNDLKI